MADKEKKKKAKNLDELMDGLKEEHSKSLDESFKAFDEFSKEENQLHLYNNIFKPAQNDLYNGIVQELDKIFEKNDNTSVYNKEKEIKKAVVAGLKKYFDKTHPAVVKAIDNLAMDEDEQYDHLMGEYDRHVGADGEKIESLRAIVNLARGRKSTVAHVKKSIDEVTDKHIENALKQLTGRYLNHHFSKYNGVEIASYLKPQLEKAGFEIEDKVGFARGNLSDMLALREQYIRKKGSKYLKAKEEKEAK